MKKPLCSLFVSINVNCSYHISEVRLRFEENEYDVIEGGVVEVCVVTEGELDSTFTAMVQSSDITAQGLW